MTNSTFRWLFENRHTGRITIAQAPNWSLTLFLVAKLIELVGPDGPDGVVAKTAGWTATGALLIWALDEIVRGVNPWRRFLGAAVLAWQVAQA